MTTPSWSRNRWRATHAAPRRDGKGSRRFQRWCCGVRLAALTFPPSPPSSPALRERKGEGASSPSPPPLSAPSRRERKGEGASSPSPPPLSAPSRRERKGEDQRSRSEILSRSPLSRAAGEGLGVRASRSAREGPGVRAARTFPAAPFHSLTAREEGGGSAEQGRY